MSTAVSFSPFLPVENRCRTHAHGLARNEPAPMKEVARRRQEMRQRMRHRRENATRGREVAERLRHKGLSLLRRLRERGVPVNVVAGHVPVKGEVDIMSLLQALHGAGHELALPVVAQRDAPLVFRRWRPGDALRQGAYGIPEPQAAAEEMLPQVLLVPLLAFDRTGVRLGYGGGYYDRTLESLRRRGQPVTAIGCAAGWQEVENIPALATDERLDWIITDEEIIRAQP